MKRISFSKILNEQGILKTSKNKILVNAIVNRHPITFWYSGPRKTVKSGRRINGEPVALGLSKKGNLLIRTYVQPPSVSKKGFEEHGWRTFMVSRMSMIEVDKETTFDIKRDKYKEGNDDSFSVTYVTSDWNKGKSTEQLPVEPTEPIQPEPQERPEVPQDTEPEPTQPEPQDRPEVPQQIKPPVNPNEYENNHIQDIYSNSLQNKIQDNDGQKTINPVDYESAVRQLYDMKRNDWISYQKEIGGNTSPGEGTRKRLERDSRIEMDNKLRDENVTVTDNQLQENIRRIKHLML
jgi:hypothetical protein